MGKKRAISIVVGMMAMVYLFLLVAVPILASMVPGCSSCNESETADITVPWKVVGPPLEVRSYWEAYKAPWIIYSIPGLVGTAMIVVILKQGGKAHG